MKQEIESNKISIEQLMHIKPRYSQDIKSDQVTYGLGSFSVLSVFLTYGRQLTKTERIFARAKKIAQWANISLSTYEKAKAKLKTKGLINVVTRDTFRTGKISFVTFTDSGWALWYKIQADRKKKNNGRQRKNIESPEFRYTELDEKIAKYWFKQLRKYWQSSKAIQSNLGTWDEQKDRRSDVIRKVRERLELENGQILLDAMKKIIQDPNQKDFFLKNVRGPEAMLNRWKNNNIAAEEIILRAEEIIKEKQNEDLKIVKVDEDFPQYTIETDEDKEYAEKVKIFWEDGFRILAGRLRLKYKTSEERCNAADIYATLCENLATYSNYNLANIQFNSNRVYINFSQDCDSKYCSYWYFVLDYYSNWKGVITMSMLWNCWFAFWKKIWKINYGEPTLEDLQQFEVIQYAQLGE